jgi:transposase
MKFVPAKGLEQQGILALHSVRSLLVKQQTMLANALLGLAIEFGLVVPKGIGKLGELMTLVEADETFPEKARRAAKELHDRCQTLAEGIETMEDEIVAHARNDERARRLATIPGIGRVKTRARHGVAQDCVVATPDNERLIRGALLMSSVIACCRYGSEFSHGLQEFCNGQYGPIPA